ncbi:pepsin-like aspartic protease [Arenimonas terrae]|uniref:A1 family peptidase n=1 Tax=Arenimonas terrae TaxID=2546226 RepID=A0A5C4RWS8_9GAMM|nr:pepsin-like aspartic protease [Arenimonas terrae]TNJ35650.1 A1 family peptidase [Arenimonas terrae]
MPAAIELATTLAHAQGAYTVATAFGSEGNVAHLILDTGSSTLAVRPPAYDPARDRALRATAWAQEIRYGGGAWAGPVLRSRLAFGHGHHARAIDDALFALIETDSPFLRGADGLFGLAYRGLDPAYDLGALLQARQGSPAVTWPWPFPVGDALGMDAFGDTLRQQPRTLLTPAFSALEQEGVVRDRFALSVGRAIVHVADDAGPRQAQAADPLNRGVLVLGGGAEQQHLYRGPFVDVRVVHDLYYNANLRAVRVGSGDPIPVSPLDAAETARWHSNALLDTGSSFLVFDGPTWRAMMAAFSRHDPSLPDQVAASAQAFAAGQGLSCDAVYAHDWPDLHLHLEAPGGHDAVLRIAASNYWPRNALRHGQTLCLLMAPLPDFPRQAILGLPLFAGHYSVFDRRGGSGQGQVRLATAA